MCNSLYILIILYNFYILWYVLSKFYNKILLTISSMFNSVSDKIELFSIVVFILWSNYIAN